MKWGMPWYRAIEARMERAEHSGFADYETYGQFVWNHYRAEVTTNYWYNLGVEREKLTSEASFMEDLGADSLDTVELVMAFEKEFDIDIPDEDAEKLRTVGDAMNYLHEKIGK